MANGKPLSASFQAHVLLETVQGDTLYAEIEFENKKKFPVTIYLLDHGVACTNKELSYNLAYDDIRLDLRFNGLYDIVPLPDPLVPAKPVTDTSRKVPVIPSGLCEFRNGKAVFFNNLPANGICVSAMPDAYMRYTLVLVSRAEVEDHKFVVIESLCRNNCISVEQLATLLGQIPYEIEKLKLVRVAYSNVTDPINNKQIEKQFRFDASVKELHEIFKTIVDPGAKKVSGCTQPASQMLVESFAERLKKSEYDTERLEMLKKGHGDLCFSVQQATLILSKFLHDREKLEAAKLLYFQCSEKDNFMQVSEVFSYNLTASELKDFIDKQVR